VLIIRRILKFLIKIQEYMQLLSVHGCVDRHYVLNILSSESSACDWSCNKKEMP